MPDPSVQWLFDITGERLAHAFIDARIITPSLCGNHKTVNRGPWVFAKETTPRCTDCVSSYKNLKTKEE